MIKLKPATAFLVVLSALTALATPYCLMLAIQKGLETADLQMAIIWSSAAAASQIASGMLNYFARKRITLESIALDQTVRNSLFNLAINADFLQFAEASPAEWASKIISTSHSFKAWLNALYNTAIPLVITALGTFGVLLNLSWKIALVSFAVMPFTAVVFMLLRKKVRTQSRAYFEANEDNYRAFTESFEALVPIRALNRNTWLSQKIEKTSKKVVYAGTRYASALALQAPLFDIYQAIVLIIVFGLGGYFIATGDTELAIVIGFQLYLAKLFNVIKSASGLYVSFHEFVEGRARSDTIRQIKQQQSPTFECTNEPEVLRIEHLHFSFGSHVVWQDYTLTLNQGEHKAILNCSGSGKTTLARLILGLYSPQSGTIALPNGSPTSIGFVPQDNFLLTGTLRENIEFLSGPIDDATYTELLDMCGLQAVSEQTHGELLGTNAMKLSGGEQRRVMLARALACKPKLLIIDQMTSELEPELCDRIFTSIAEMRPKLAILYLGHRTPFSNQQT